MHTQNTLVCPMYEVRRGICNFKMSMLLTLLGIGSKTHLAFLPAPLRDASKFMNFVGATELTFDQMFPKHVPSKICTHKTLYLVVCPMCEYAGDYATLIFPCL